MLMTDECRSFLSGRRIVVTRAPHQAKEFGRKLAQSGALVLYLPLIRIAASEDAACPEPLASFDWLVLTSANGVRFLDECLQKAGRSFKDLRKCRVAVVGKSTAGALADHGLNAEVIPGQHVAEALVKELLQAEPAPAGKRVLLAQGSKASPQLACSLKLRGMQVTALTCYDTNDRPPTPEEIESLVAFAPDAVTFFSPSAVHAFAGADLPKLFSGLPRSIVYASIGPVTTKAVEKAGLEPIIEAPLQLEDNLIETLNDYFEGK